MPYQRGIAEFSSFSKNFKEKAPQPKTGLQNFLSMFHEEKHDPSAKEEETKDNDDIIVSDYLRYEKGEVLVTEAVYVTKIAQVKGVLRFTEERMHFEPVSVNAGVS